MAGKTKNVVARVRAVMDATGTADAAPSGMSIQTFRRARYVITLADDDTLPTGASEVARKAYRRMLDTDQVLPSWEMVQPIVERRYGPEGMRRGMPGGPSAAAARVLDDFGCAFWRIIGSCLVINHLPSPYLPDAELRKVNENINKAIRELRAFKVRINEEV